MRNVILQEFVSLDGLAAGPNGSAEREVAKLKHSAGKDMVIWGSISLAQSLITAGLIDQYQLVVCPVVWEAERRSSATRSIRST